MTKVLPWVLVGFVASILALLAWDGVARRRVAAAPPDARKPAHGWLRDCPGRSPSDVFRDGQLALINEHAKILMDEGRMPEDFGDAFSVLGTYGWHSASDPGVSTGGTVPSLGVLNHGRGGAFGAYSFSPEAFEQAKRCWWIHGVMEAGSDILVPVNRNAQFRTWCDETFTMSASVSFTTTVSFVDANGNAVPPLPPLTAEEVAARAADEKAEREEAAKQAFAEREARCPNKMGSPIGYRIGYIAAWDEQGNFVPITDATVIGMPTHPDGSLKGTLQLDKKAKGFARSYDIAILPPDYVDMCACTMGEPVTVTVEEE